MSADWLLGLTSYHPTPAGIYRAGPLTDELPSAASVLDRPDDE